MYLLIKIILIIYTATCTLLTFAQVDNSTRKVEWTNSDRACSIFFNLFTVGLFLLIWFGNYITTNQWFILVIAAHHFIRATYNIYDRSEIKEWSMTEIYINMIVYAGTVYGMILLWLL